MPEVSQEKLRQILGRDAADTVFALYHRLRRSGGEPEKGTSAPEPQKATTWIQVSSKPEAFPPAAHTHPYISVETDPTVPAAVKAITEEDIAKWDKSISQEQGDARYRRLGVNIHVSEIDGLPAAPSVAQFTVGDGVSKDITITHNLGTQQIVDVALRRVSDNSRRYVGWSAPTEDTVVLGTFGIAPGESSLVASISYISPTPTTP